MRMLMTVVIVLVAVLLVAALVYQRTRRSDPAGDVDAYMARRAQQAMERATADYAKSLDLSPASVEHVESILSQIHERHQSQPYPESHLIEEANIWGAYIGEVAKRIRQGSWHRDSPFGGKGSAPLVHGDNKDEIYPLAWAYHRITKGTEENVWNKFQLNYFPERFKRIDLDSLQKESDRR